MIGKLIFTAALSLGPVMFLPMLAIAQASGGSGTGAETPKAGFLQIYRERIEGSFLEERVVEPDESTVLRQYQYALDSYYNLRYWESLQAFQRVAREFPNTLWAKRSQFKIGEIYEKMGRHEEAIGEYRKVLGFYTDTALDDLALYRIGNIYKRQNSHVGGQKAIETYLELVSKYPNSTYTPRSYFHVAELYWSAGMWDEAERYFRMIAKNYPDSKWEGGVSIAREAQIYQDISGYLSRSKKAGPDYSNLRRQSEAIRNYSLALSLSSDQRLNQITYLRIAQAYESLGMEDEAIDYYLRSSQDKEAPFSDYASFRISEIYYNKYSKNNLPENRTRALDSYRGFMTRYPHSRFVSVALDRVNSLQGSSQGDGKNGYQDDSKDYRTLYAYQRALVEYSKLLETYPDSQLVHRAYSHIAEALGYIGLWEDAKKVYLSKAQGSARKNQGSGVGGQGPEVNRLPIPGPLSPAPALSISMMGLGDLLSNSSYPARDPKEAIKVYSEVADIFSGSEVASQALYNTGKLYEELGLWEQALWAYWDALSQGHHSPWSDSSLYAIGNLYQAGKVNSLPGPKSKGDLQKPIPLSDVERYEMALGAFTDLIDTYPESSLAPQALFQSGKLLAALGRVGEARDRFSLVISRYSDYKGSNGRNWHIDAQVELDLLKGRQEGAGGN
jgi:tetratricopeptide (TPR) repeat protein